MRWRSGPVGFESGWRTASGGARSSYDTFRRFPLIKADMAVVRIDDHLVRYLLGDLPEEEMDRLDELSVTDEEFVQRLRETEYDLVDACARGELTGELQSRVRAFY